MAVLVVSCLLVKLPVLAAVAAVGPLSAAAATTALKPLVGRTINGENLAFPSGHTAFATGIALVVALLAIHLISPRGPAAAGILAGVTVVIGAVMATDQVVLNAHYPTDTVGGFFTACAVVPLAALVADWLVGQFWRGRTRTAPLRAWR